MGKKKAAHDDVSQVERFRRLAKEVGADDADALDKALKKIARPKRRASKKREK